MRKLLALILLAIPAFATTPVTGHISLLNTGTPGNTAFVRFWLRHCGANQPRITGTGAIAPQFNGTAFYVDLPADASGNISGTIYSTRNNAGTGNGDIECGGSYTAVSYGMQIYNNGVPGPEVPVHAKSGATLDISNVTPLTTAPVVTQPTGDSTYLRLDGGNSPITGGFTSQGNNAFAGSNTFSGTLGIYNHNGIFWAGSQQTPSAPTITAAEASGNAVGVCRFDISPVSTSADSPNLITNSMGYKVYESPTKCFGYDNRQNVTFGAAPMYNELIMGYNAGALTAVGINLWAASFGNPIPNSTTAGSNFLWIGGPTVATKLPAAGGDQIALAGVVNTVDKVDVNGSPSSLEGIDGECNLNNTTMTGTFPGCWGGTFGAHITRAESTAVVSDTGAIHAFGFGNMSSSGGGANNIHVIEIEAPGSVLSTGEAFSLWSKGNILVDQNVSIYAHPSGSTGTPVEHLRFAGSGVGFKQNAFSVTAGAVGLGLQSNPFGFIWLSGVATNAYLLNPINPAGARTINIQDGGTANTNLGQYLSATTAAFAPGLMAANTCSTQAATTVTGATTGMAATVTPASDPGTGLTWEGIVASGTVALRLCNITAAGVTPTSTSYNIRVHI